jgi:1-acyl-sn-glycerol-3-phosphate acyltransferase
MNMADIMPTPVSGAPKPHSTLIRPEITRLPNITRKRRVIRWGVNWLARLLVGLWTSTKISGLENIPQHGPALIVSNHLGDADVIVGISCTPVMVDVLAKAELYDFPVLGWLMDAYGVIWVHRGYPDKRAIRAALKGLQDGRIIAIAPEGRESLTGGLEEGTGGAAYLAVKSNVPIIPVTFTGTENKRVLRNLMQLKRSPITVTIGSPLRLVNLPDLKESIRLGTERIMDALANQLPPRYRGVYRTTVEDQHGYHKSGT